MKRNLRKVLGAAFMLLSISWAQTGSPFIDFNLRIDPEYNHPGVGIFIDGTIQPGKFPRYTELQVPLATTVVLLRKGDGEDNSEQVEIKERDGKKFLALDLSEAKFSVQFFFNPFTNGSTDREFTYELVINEELPEWHVILQQPVMAVDFTHSLNEADVLDGEFGLKFYRQHSPNLAAGVPHAITVKYSNPTNTLTMDEIRPLMEQQQAADNAAAMPASNSSNMLTVFLAFVALAIIVFVVVKKIDAKKDSGQNAPSGKAKNANAGSTGKGKFCSNCGANIRSGAKFCPSCGKAI